MKIKYRRKSEWEEGRNKEGRKAMRKREGENS
jgi:hypothetical protein